MKTITNLSNISLHVFDDDEYLNIADNCIFAGVPVKLCIADCNINNVKLFHKVTLPEDWVGGKYFFDGVDWTLNPDYVAPVAMVEALA